MRAIAIEGLYASFLRINDQDEPHAARQIDRTFGIDVALRVVGRKNLHDEVGSNRRDLAFIRRERVEPLV